MDVPALVLDVVGPSSARLRRLVEGELGWPAVRPGDEVVPAAVRVLDVPAARAAGPGEDGLPTVLVVDDDDPVEAATAALGVAAVVPVGVDAEALRAVVTRVRRRPAGRRAWCLLGSAAGGVGGSTVAAALAGLRAWRDGRTLLVTSGAPHHPDVPEVDPGDLGSPATWLAGVPSAGLADLRVVAWAPGATTDPGPVADAAVVELGTSAADARVPGPDVLVLRPDRAGARAATRHADAALVVVGDGPVDVASDRRSAPVVRLPWSARVAAAAAAERLPAALPGRWLRQLGPVVDHLDAAARP